MLVALYTAHSNDANALQMDDDVLSEWTSTSEQSLRLKHVLLAGLDSSTYRTGPADLKWPAYTVWRSSINQTGRYFHAFPSLPHTRTVALVSVALTMTAHCSQLSPTLLRIERRRFPEHRASNIVAESVGRSVGCRRFLDASLIEGGASTFNWT